MVESAKKSPDLIMKLWELVKASVDASMEDSDIESFPDGCSLLGLFVAHSPTISHLWEYYEIILAQISGSEQA